MMDFDDMFDDPPSPERLLALRNLLREELTDRQRTLILASVLAATLPDEKIALLISGMKAFDEAYQRVARKLNISK